MLRVCSFYLFRPCSLAAVHFSGVHKGCLLCLVCAFAVLQYSSTSVVCCASPVSLFINCIFFLFSFPSVLHTFVSSPPLPSFPISFLSFPSFSLSYLPCLVRLLQQPSFLSFPLLSIPSFLSSSLCRTFPVLFAFSSILPSYILASLAPPDILSRLAASDATPTPGWNFC